MSSLNLPTLRLPSGAKFWKKRSANISEYDPTFRAIYLGNVLTSWAKGDGCADKPLATLWKNYTTTEKPNIVMKVTVCASGLKAVTKEHGLTEYWANRITFCDADPDYPRVFCWIYRHEGRKMKQELRCHAVLCPSENKARLMAKRLRERLHQALIDFKKEKISRQNARLSLANSAYDNPSMPYRKILLQTGSANYRPPVERGKAAPKLKVIEEVILEEEEEDLSAERPESWTVRTSTRPELRSEHSTSSSASEISFGGDSDTEVLLYPGRMVSDDAVSLASTVFDLATVGGGGAVSDNPQASDLRTVRNACSVVDGPAGAHQRESVGDSDDDDEDDDDEVTDYLQTLRVVEVDSATASLSPESGRQFGRISHSSRSSSTSTSSRKTVEELDMEDEEAKLPEGARARHPEEHQDTISDESGYSEDSNTSGKHGPEEEEEEEDEVTPTEPAEPANVPHQPSTPPRPTTRLQDVVNEEDDCDLSVKGVMITDFSTAERFRYLQRSRTNVQRARADFLQNKVTEFCINI